MFAPDRSLRDVQRPVPKATQSGARRRLSHDEAVPRNRRLLIVSPTFWPEPIGTPKYATDTALWFAARGHRVAVITAQPFYPNFELYDGYGRRRRRDRLDGVQIVRVPTIVPSGGRALWRTASDLNFAVQVLVRSAMRSVPAPDAVLSFSPGVPLAVAAAASFARGRPHVAVIHDIQAGLGDATGLAHPRLISAIARAERACLGVADRGIVLSEEMKVQLEAMRVCVPLNVVPIWADIPVHQPRREEFGRVKSEFVVQYSGNFGRKQGVPFLLDVAEQLRDVTPRIVLQLRGAGQLLELLRADISRRSLHNVRIADLVAASELGAGLRAADLHIVPQLPGTGHFSMPSKVVNILASGRPLLAVSERGSPLERLATSASIAAWAPISDAHAVVQRVRRLADDALERFQLAARAACYVRGHHDRDRLLTAMEDWLFH